MVKQCILVFEHNLAKFALNEGMLPNVGTYGYFTSKCVIPPLGTMQHNGVYFVALWICRFYSYFPNCRKFANNK
jgi:hypothetical protein